MDGFIKNNDESFIILPSVHKYAPPSKETGATVIGEMVIKANCLP